MFVWQIMTKRTITSGKQYFLPALQRLYAYKALVYVFAVRDLKVQYSQTFMGILWSLMQPLTGLLIFTFFFSYVVKVDTGGIPYPLFAFSGMISWYFFSALMAQSGTSLMQSQYLIRKIYFPKLVLPVAKALSCFAEFGIALALLLVIMPFWGFYPGINIVFLPIFILLNVLTGLSAGLWLSALTVRYRDFYHIIPYLLNFGIWLTPVFYPVSILPHKIAFLIYFNPLAGIVEGFRWTLLGAPMPDVKFLWSFLFVAFVFVSGLMYFRRMENKMADLV